MTLLLAVRGNIATRSMSGPPFSLQLHRTTVWCGATKNVARGERRYGAEVFSRIRDFLSSVREIDIPGLPEEIQLLAAVDGIDPGEAVLFTATAQFDQYLLATGDKNSIRALASAPLCLPIAQRICGHVMCLEQIVKRVIQYWGFPYVKDKLIPARACDTALRVAFGSGSDAIEPNVLATLDIYINELRSLSIDLLV